MIHLLISAFEEKDTQSLKNIYQVSRKQAFHWFDTSWLTQQLLTSPNQPR